MVENERSESGFLLSSRSFLAKFFLVGALNTFFGYGVFAGFLWIGFHYSFSAAISTILGVLFNFKTTGIFLFKNKDNSRIFLFVLVYVFVYVVNIALISVLSCLGLNAYLSGLFLAIPMALLAFFLNKKFVFI